MGRKVLLAFICWLAITSASGEPEANPSKDSVSEKSAPQPLYQNVPNAVYASAVPYGSFSFNFPTYAVAPKTSASQLTPSTVAYLKDSYGNKFVDTLQSAAYKTMFPQQYVSLQGLPSHLAQPLVTAPNYQHKQGPQYYFGSQYRVPTFQAGPPTVRYAGFSQPYVNAQNAAPSASYSQVNSYATPQQQPSVSSPIYANTHTKGEPNYQEYVKQSHPVRYLTNENNQHATHSERVQHQAAPEKLTAVTSADGKHTVIITTRPNLPLLDLNLLEPLKFDNPFVPQIQHFLPRIHGATYQKLPQYINNGGSRQHSEIAQKPNNHNNHQNDEAPKRQPKTSPPIRQNKPKSNNKIPVINSPVKTTIINSPNHKEIINEQIISYNKETTSDPVVYSYNVHSAEDPKEYKYTRKPVKHVSYNNGPNQVISHSNEHNSRPNSPPQRPPQQPSSDVSGETGESSAESEEESPSNYQREEDYEENHGNANRKPEHSGEEIRYDSNQDEPREEHRRPIHHHTQPHNVHTSEPDLQPIRPDYDRDILHSSYKPNANIKVDPSQHIRHYNVKSTPPPVQRHPQQAQRTQPPRRPQPTQNYRPQNYEGPVSHVQEKSKRIIIQEESPDEMHSHEEQMSAEMIASEENKEADFEKAYKNAAYGFPSYVSNEAEDTEKDPYNPQLYFISDNPSHFNEEFNPFQRYRVESDAYPKSASPSYIEDKEKMKEEYALEFAINKPTSMLDQFKSKESYYKMYDKYKPVEYFSAEQSREPKQKSKYTAASSHSGYAPKPKTYEYDYSKKAPHDNSAFASRPNHRYKDKTFFVEPQFQYGFEPISIPRLLDSELAAATLSHPENEKPMRKKVYKENWYIKKTSTSGGKPSS